MKHQLSKFASRMVILALACSTIFGVIACGGDDDETAKKTDVPQPQVDEPEPELSEQTTPVKFETGYGNRYMFDYGGGKYLGSDTLSKGWGTSLDLRQGKHHLVWFKDLSDYGGYSGLTYNFEDDYEQVYWGGVHYDPVKRVVKLYDYDDLTAEYLTYPKETVISRVKYAEMELLVYPTLLPTQKVNFTHLTCGISITATDMTSGLAKPELNPNPSSGTYTEPVVGEVTIPYIYSLSLKDNSIEKDERVSTIRTYAQNWDPQTLVYENVGIMVGGAVMLCPPEGVQNIQLKAKVFNANGKYIPTTPLPAISVKRGYTTVLEGPLFSGTQSDWKVSYKPMED